MKGVAVYAVLTDSTLYIKQYQYSIGNIAPEIWKHIEGEFQCILVDMKSIAILNPKNLTFSAPSRCILRTYRVYMSYIVYMS